MSAPILAFAAWSGTGKTTLLEQLIPLLKTRGLRIAVIKHAHHDFDIDTPGKDSYRLRKSGADQVMVASRHRSALIIEHDDGRDEPRLAGLIAQLEPAHLDLILAEGFKHEVVPTIELHRAALGKPLLYPNDPSIIALVTDTAPDPQPSFPVLDLNDPAAVADFVIGYVQRQRH